MTKPSDLPEFSSIADAHENVLGASAGYDGDDDETGMPDFTDEPMARDWIEGLSADLPDAPYVAPLVDVIRKVSAMSGVECPELDESEMPRSAVIVEEGFDGDG